MKIVKKALRTVFIMMLCAATICGSALADTAEYTGTFPDIPADAAYAEAAEYLSASGIMQGDTNGNFNPNQNVTRAQMAAIICRMLGVEDEAKAMTNQVFTDVPTSYWAVGYIAKAAELSIIDGYGNGKFGPSNSVTYAQIVKMLVCAWGYKETAENAGGWSQGYLNIANELGITRNISFTSSEPAPRSAVAQIVYNTTMIPTAYENGGTVE